MKQQGFSLIELVIALAISAMVSLVLYRTFYRTVRLVDQSGAMIEDYGDILIIANQLERDLSAIFIPLTPSITTTTKTLSAPSQAPTANAQSTQAHTAREAFSYANAEGKLASLSFCTTSALPQIDHPNSRLVFVRYSLVAQPHTPQEKQSPLFALVREEIPYASPTKQIGRAYTLMGNLEAIACTCYYHLFNKNETTNTLTKLDTWQVSKQKNAQLPAVPEFVEFTGTYRSKLTEASLPFSFLIPIPSSALFVFEQQQKATEQEQVNNQRIPAKVQP